MRKIFRTFNKEEFEKLAKAGFQPKNPLSKEEKMSLLKEVKRIYIPFTFLDSLLYVLGGGLVMPFIPVLMGIFIEGGQVSIVLKVIFYFLGISFVIFGIHQIFARVKCSRTDRKRLELLKEILIK